MKNFIFALLLFVITMPAQAQTTPRFAKYPIAHTGCQAYFPSAPGEFSVQKSDDSLDIYMGEAVFNNVNYGIELVDITAMLVNFGSDEDLENLATGYMDFLKTQMGVTSAAGYGKGHKLASNPNALGIIDYWQDEDEINYKVKAWIDTNFLAVLMVYATDELNENITNLFLDGFRFPEQKK